MTHHLRVWDSDRADVVDVPLQETQTVELRCVRGASRLHVVVAEEETVRLRAELQSDPEETIALQLDIDGDGNVDARSPGRHVLVLPPDDRYQPLLPIVPAASDAPLDLAIVVDGTLRAWKKPEQSGQSAKTEARSVLLLGRKELWRAHVEVLVDFVSRVAEGHRTRVGVLAFGDQAPPSSMAADLQPLYRVHPPEQERSFQKLDVNRLRVQLENIPPTPGGDFVDALADALGACVDLRWRKDARKVVIVTGDSPGASLLDPLSPSADLCVRRSDVDTQTERLHRSGIELVTIYHAPLADLGLHQISYQGDLLTAVENQYRRLASIPEFAWSAATFEPELAADCVRGTTVPVARGAMFGELVRVTEPT
jgi:hypothetical protein